MTPLSYALLGLIRAEARSGYALRKVFETTPMGSFSSSPGSVYPALKNLQKAGVVESRPAGKKSVFAITPGGEAAFDAWLRQPVTAGENTDIALLRFAFLHDYPDRQLSLAFLLSYARACHDKIVGLKAFMTGDTWQEMPLQTRLAVMHGLRITEAAAEWAAEAHLQLSEEIKP